MRGRPSRTWRTISFACSAALASLLLATPAAAFPGANGQIAFTSRQDGNLEIYAMNADGTAQTRLTNNVGADSRPAWSPDGTRIAFTSTRDGNYEIYAMNADGSSPINLSTNVHADFSPAWSPDGTKIAFTSDRDDGGDDIYAMNADGSAVTRLTNNGASDRFPAWSADGTTIAFVSNRDADQNDEIFGMNADGSAQTQFTNTSNVVVNSEPKWSPDSMKIVFETDRDDPNAQTCFTCNFEIYTMNARGTAEKRITHDPATDTAPAWSPDGTKIAFQSNRDGNDEIYTLNANGSGPIRLTTNLAEDQGPDWQPLPGSSPPPSYPTPKLASPIQMALVPVFKQCGSGGNPVSGSHSPPLSVGSCPPQPSGLAHFGPQAKGTAWVATIYGDTNTANGDQADMTLRFDLSDIRTGAGSDYDPNPTGADASLITRLRFTDRSNGGTGTDPGTATDFDFSVPVACTATSDTAVGSNCALDTSADAVNPGMIKENKGTVLQVFRLRLNDSGANGIRGDGDDRLFATQGVFVP